jgi:hypothetical protein
MDFKFQTADFRITSRQGAKAAKNPGRGPLRIVAACGVLKKWLQEKTKSNTLSP